MNIDLTKSYAVIGKNKSLQVLRDGGDPDNAKDYTPVERTNQMSAKIQHMIKRGFVLTRGGDPNNASHYEMNKETPDFKVHTLHSIVNDSLKPQSTEVKMTRVIGRIIDSEHDENDLSNNEMLKGKFPIEAEVVSMQEEGKDEVKVKSKNEIPLNLTEKVFYYEQAIKKDEKNILAAKERITFNKIRLKKLQTFMAKQKRDAEKLALDL